MHAGSGHKQLKRTMQKTCCSLFFCCALCLWLSGCNSLFFYPTKAWVQNPSRQGLDYEDIILIHEDGKRLHGWWLPASTGQVTGTVYFLHGNAQNLSTHLMNVAWLPAAGFHVFLLDYRGYGLSEGEAEFPGVFHDVQLGLDWMLASQRIVRPLVVYGQSLGGSLAGRVMARAENAHVADCVILEAAFTGFRDIARDVMSSSVLLWPWRYVVIPLIHAEDNLAAHIHEISPTPLLVMHSREDEVIPWAHAERLFEHAREPKAFRQLSGPHSAGIQDSAVRDYLADFMKRGCRD